VVPARRQPHVRGGGGVPVWGARRDRSHRQQRLVL